MLTTLYDVMSTTPNHYAARGLYAGLQTFHTSGDEMAPGLWGGKLQLCAGELWCNGMGSSGPIECGFASATGLRKMWGQLDPAVPRKRFAAGDKLVYWGRVSEEMNELGRGKNEFLIRKVISMYTAYSGPGLSIYIPPLTPLNFGSCPTSLLLISSVPTSPPYLLHLISGLSRKPGACPGWVIGVSRVVHRLTCAPLIFGGDIHNRTDVLTTSNPRLVV